jgi:hypothetical protein
VGAVIRRLTNSAVAPWAGLFLGAAGWFLHHQAGSDTNVWDCRTAGGGFTIGLGVICALVVAGGGLISWAASVPEPPAAHQYRQFARWVGMAGAAIFLLAIGFQTLAGALVPACLR